MRKISTQVKENEQDFFQAGDYKLFQNYPNPFNGNTTINYQLKKPGRVSLKIIDLRGKIIRKLVETYQPVGIYIINWNSRDSYNKDISSGIYLYQLKVDNRKIVRKLMFIK